MAHQFTQNPAQGQVDVLANGRKFQFNAGRWEIFTNTLPLNVAPVVMTVPPIVSMDAPALPNSNPFWIEQGTNVLYVQNTSFETPIWTRCTPDVQAPLPIESETPPAMPSDIPFWFKPSTSVMHYQYDDGNSLQWIEI